MNGVAPRAEKALVDYLAAGDWSGAGAGTPSFLTSYSRGLYDDPDEQDTMPNFPRVVVSSTSARPIQRTDLTCEVDIEIELQLSADDTTPTNTRRKIQMMAVLPMALVIGRGVP